MTLNPTAFIEKVQCLSFEASPSPANYSRTPRDYLIQRESVLFQPQAERTALYLSTAIVSHCHMVLLLSLSPAGSRDGCLLLQFLPRWYPHLDSKVTALLVHSQIFSNCFLKL